AAAAPASAPAAVAPDDLLAPLSVALDRSRARAPVDDDAVHTDLWARVRAGFSLPDMDNDLVHKWEQWYSSRPDYVRRMTERGGRYLFYIVEETKRRKMPVELALLPFVESAFNPQAMSVARAAGMWQFTPGTGRHFELKQNLFRDDRRDVLASTRAALDYLQRLHDMFGDWSLALAAYNCGEGTVQRAIDRNRRAGLPTDYESLRLPEETRNYVPKLQAVKNIVARPADFALTLPPLQNHPFFLSVAIDRDIDVEIAARLAGMSLADFKELNPQQNKPVILAAGTPQVLLPYDNANRFLRQLEMHRGPLATWTAWVAPKTVSPAAAARQVGMSEAELRAINRIPPRMLVKAGSTLLVPRAARHTSDVAEEVADNAEMVLAPEPPPLRKVSFRVGRKGTTVAAVAHRYRVSPQQVAQWNGVGAKAGFKSGQTVVVMLAPKSRFVPHHAAHRATRLAEAGRAHVTPRSVRHHASHRATRPAEAGRVRVAMR
ncbi:MAG: transglycosylase SLT domain-containing protein, partial [Burkholderiales bacterium]|nr:transglycosylase SLT domain-containing protein [Burkholderiales bacterium]